MCISGVSHLRNEKWTYNSIIFSKIPPENLPHKLKASFTFLQFSNLEFFRAWATLHPIPLHPKLSLRVFFLFLLLHNMKMSEHILVKISISKSPKWCEKSWKISEQKRTLGKIRTSENSSEGCNLMSVSTQPTFPKSILSPVRLGHWGERGTHLSQQWLSWITLAAISSWHRCTLYFVQCLQPMTRITWSRSHKNSVPKK